MRVLHEKVFAMFGVREMENVAPLKRQHVYMIRSQQLTPEGQQKLYNTTATVVAVKTEIE
jgi:hypothetical protein